MRDLPDHPGDRRLAGLKGHGTDEAADSAKTDFTGAWKGDFKTPSQKTSRR